MVGEVHGAEQLGGTGWGWGQWYIAAEEYIFCYRCLHAKLVSVVARAGLRSKLRVTAAGRYVVR